MCLTLQQLKSGYVYLCDSHYVTACAKHLTLWTNVRPGLKTSAACFGSLTSNITFSGICKYLAIVNCQPLLIFFQMWSLPFPALFPCRCGVILRARSCWFYFINKLFTKYIIHFFVALGFNQQSNSCLFFSSFSLAGFRFFLISYISASTQRLSHFLLWVMCLIMILFSC